MPLSALPAPLPRPSDAASTVATALQCVICMFAERSHACVPCGHKCLCEGCADVAKVKTCPMCRKEVMMMVQVWE